LKIIRSIDWIDNKLKENGILVNYNRHYKVAIAISLSYYSVLLFSVTLDNYLYQKYLPDLIIDKLDGIFALINIAAYLSYQLTHMLLIGTVYFRLKFIKEIVVSKGSEISTIQSIQKIFVRLHKTVNDINSCFALNLINFFFQFLVFNIFFYFSLYHYVATKNSSPKEFVFIIILFGYLQYYFWFAAWVIFFSGLMNAEIENITEAIRIQEMNNFENLKLMKNLNIFSMLVNHCKIYITTGLFNADWPFLFVMIGANFSYLIILVQFDIA
jgi:hypothetical protein